MTTKKQTYQYIALVNIGTNPPTKAGDVVVESALSEESLAIHLDRKHIKRVAKKDKKQ